MKDFYLGIDPGLSGAVAFYSPSQDLLEVYDMPTHTVKTNGKQRRKIDFHQLAAIIRRCAPLTSKALLEEVNAMPGQGVTSMFSFGKAAGAAEMALAYSGVTYDLVSPVKWKRAMRVTGNKDEARRAASRLMPVHAHWWARAKDDGRAEAALIAYYAVQECKPLASPPKLDLAGML
jgi:crossover junction endodeoxyribonuclease RuvC